MASPTSLKTLSNSSNGTLAVVAVEAAQPELPASLSKAVASPRPARPPLGHGSCDTPQVVRARRRSLGKILNRPPLRQLQASEGPCPVRRRKERRPRSRGTARTPRGTRATRPTSTRIQRPRPRRAKRLYRAGSPASTPSSLRLRSLGPSLAGHRDRGTRAKVSGHSTSRGPRRQPRTGHHRSAERVSSQHWLASRLWFRSGLRSVPWAAAPGLATVAPLSLSSQLCVYAPVAAGIAASAPDGVCLSACP